MPLHYGYLCGDVHFANHPADGWRSPHETLTVRSLPSALQFDLDLCPSLDKIEKAKDLVKAKKQAEKVLKQYEKDIDTLIAGRQAAGTYRH